MVHVRFIAQDPLACHGARDFTVVTAMIGKELVPGRIKIELNDSTKSGRNLLLPRRRALGDAVPIGKVGAGAINANDPKAVCTMLSRHHFKMGNPLANLLCVFIVTLQQGR